MADYVTLEQLNAPPSGGGYVTLPQLAGMSAPQEPGFLSDPLGFVKRDLAAVPGRVGDLAAGFVRGAGSIGATGMRLLPSALGGDTAAENAQRRTDMDQALQSFGADPSSLQYGAGKLGAEIAGTAGAGGALANGARAVLPMLRAAPAAVDAIAGGLQSGGFRAPGMAGFPALAARAGTGAIAGGTMAGMIDPNQASTGALIGGGLPGATQAAGAVGNVISGSMEGGARKLMQSAIKPTIKQLQTGQAETAVQTLLDNGINPTRGGVEKLRQMIDATDNKITSAIAGSNATIDKANTLGPLLQTRSQFGAQVSPGADLNAIDNTVSDYLNHPTYPGMTLPVQAAQDMKRGTYSVLAKKYGQMGGAETEAQKSLARGLKDEIAAAVPGISDLNAQQSKLLDTLSVTERRALMEVNKNPMGLAALAHNPASWAMFMADKSALFKSLAARALNSAAQVPGAPMGLLGNAAASPVLRGGLLSIEASP
jgi:hypothetical protein